MKIQPLMNRNFNWIPFHEHVLINRLSISGIQISSEDPHGSAPEFAIDPAAPAETGPPERRNGDFTVNYRDWSPSLRAECLRWWSAGRPARTDDHVTEAFCRLAFANWEFRLLNGDFDQSLWRALTDLLSTQQATMHRTGLARKFNQLAQVIGYQAGPEQHVGFVHWLRSISGLSWTHLETNFMMSAFQRCGTPLKAEEALFAVWHGQPQTQREAALGAWEKLSEAFQHEFVRIFPDGFLLTPGTTMLPFGYEPSHPDIARLQKFPATINYFDFYAEHRLARVDAVFQAALNTAIPKAAPAASNFPSNGANNRPASSPQTQHKFTEVTVRAGKPRQAGDRISPAAGDRISPTGQVPTAVESGALEAAVVQDQATQELLQQLMRGEATAAEMSAAPEGSASPRFNPALVMPLRSALQIGNIPAELAHRVHVGGSDVLKIIGADAEIVGSGGSSFRFLVGLNGRGKTHVLNLIATIAMARGFVLLRVELRPDCRFHGRNGEVRTLMGEMVRTLAFEGSEKGKGLANLLERIRNHAGGATDEEATRAVTLTCGPLLECPGGPEMVDMIVTYCSAVDSGDKPRAAKALAWFRAEYSTPAQTNRALGTGSHVTDSDLIRHLRLLALLSHVGGFKGVMVLVDELSVLTRNLHGTVRQANQDAILNLVNDVSAGRLGMLGFYFAGTHDAFDPTQRGLLGSEALKSRLQSSNETHNAGIVVEIPALRKEQLFLLLQKVRSLRLPEHEWRDRLPDGALQALLEQSFRHLGAELGLAPRDLLKNFEALVKALELDSAKSWRDVVGNSASKPTSKNNSLSSLTL